MAKIEIYTKATCPYCHRAKALLASKGAAFDEIAIDGDADKREGMIARSASCPFVISLILVDLILLILVLVNRTAIFPTTVVG